MPRPPPFHTPALARQLPGEEPPRPTGALIDGIALFLLACLLYARSAGFGWLEVSDAPARSAESLRQAWNAGGLAGLGFFLVDGADSGALGARLLALALHAGSSVLAGSLARRLGLPRLAALLVGSLFAVHPLRVEAVAWLAQRGTLLGTFFLLAANALAFAARPRSIGRRVLGTGAWILALAAEPALVLVLPWSVWLARRSRTPSSGARASPAWRPEPELALVAALGLLWFALDRPDPARVAQVPFALARLAATWLWPLELTLSHGSGGLVRPAWLVALTWAALLGLVAGLVRAIHRRFNGAVGIHPVSGLVWAGGLFFVLAGAFGAAFRNGEAAFSETTGHGAAFGLELALVAAGWGAWSRVRAARIPLVALSALGLGLGFLRSTQRLADWRGESELQHSALAVRPDDPRAHDALGLWHLAHGRLSAAQLAFERALEQAPRDPRARLHLAELELRRALIPGPQQEAHLRAAETILLASPPASRVRAAVELRLGECYQRGRDLAAALPHLERAVALDPDQAQAHTRLGMVRLALAAGSRNELEAARTAFRTATDLAPHSAEAWGGLGLVALQANEQEAARTFLERALRLEPDLVESRAALGHLQELAGQRAEAEANYRHALGVNPDYVDGLYSLGALLAAGERVDEALRCFDRVVGLARGQPHVRAFLASARLHMQRGEREIPRRLLAAVLDFNPAQAEARALFEVLEADGKH